MGTGLGAVGSAGDFEFFAVWQKIAVVVLMWLGRFVVCPVAAIVAATSWRRWNTDFALWEFRNPRVCSPE